MSVSPTAVNATPNSGGFGSHRSPRSQMRLAWATSDDLPATTIRASANYLRTRFIAAALGFLETGRRRSEPLCLECRPLALLGLQARSELNPQSVE